MCVDKMERVHVVVTCREVCRFADGIQLDVSSQLEMLAS